jgi:hypothetical protein
LTTASRSEPTHAELFGLEGSTTSRTDRSGKGRRKRWRRRPDGRFERTDTMPAWYADVCAALSRAVWRDQVTDDEAIVVAVLHPLALGEAFPEDAA